MSPVMTADGTNAVGIPSMGETSAGSGRNQYMAHCWLDVVTVKSHPSLLPGVKPGIHVVPTQAPEELLTPPDTEAGKLVPDGVEHDPVPLSLVPPLTGGMSGCEVSVTCIEHTRLVPCGTAAPVAAFAGPTRDRAPRTTTALAAIPGRNRLIIDPQQKRSVRMIDAGSERVEWSESAPKAWSSTLVARPPNPLAPAVLPSTLYCG